MASSYPVLCQKEMPKSTLLNDLFGSKSINSISHSSSFLHPCNNYKFKTVTPE